MSIISDKELTEEEIKYLEELSVHLLSSAMGWHLRFVMQLCPETSSWPPVEAVQHIEVQFTCQ